MSENNNLEELRANGDGEISLTDIVEFVQESWRQLLLAGLVGAALGFGGWFFFGDLQNRARTA